MACGPAPCAVRGFIASAPGLPLARSARSSANPPGFVSFRENSAGGRRLVIFLHQPTRGFAIGGGRRAVMSNREVFLSRVQQAAVQGRQYRVHLRRVPEEIGYL